MRYKNTKNKAVNEDVYIKQKSRSINVYNAS